MSTVHLKTTCYTAECGLEELFHLLSKTTQSSTIWSEPNLPHQGQSQYLISWAYAISNSTGGR
jgi:hypothetical protein